MTKKTQLTKELDEWLNDFVMKKYSEEYDVKIIIPKSNLNLLQEKRIQELKEVNLLEFQPDILGILTNKVSKETELIFIFRGTKTVGFTLIGEVLTYCKLVNPKLAIIASTNSVSSYVDEWINIKKEMDIVSFDSKKIIIFQWDEKTKRPDPYTITPIEKRSFFD